MASIGSTHVLPVSRTFHLLLHLLVLPSRPKVSYSPRSMSVRMHATTNSDGPLAHNAIIAAIELIYVRHMDIGYYVGAPFDWDFRNLMLPHSNASLLPPLIAWTPDARGTPRTTALSVIAQGAPPTPSPPRQPDPTHHAPTAAVRHLHCGLGMLMAQYAGEAGAHRTFLCTLPVNGCTLCMRLLVGLSSRVSSICCPEPAPHGALRARCAFRGRPDSHPMPWEDDIPSATSVFLSCFSVMAALGGGGSSTSKRVRALLDLSGALPYALRSTLPGVDLRTGRPAIRKLCASDPS
ncbi:hypothetical protein BJ912DRAFT_1148247 [Pholiota molesta]|nr:hypothetical protein BJ912DRAFT_1148247 [Pholiota molesta]